MARRKKHEEHANHEAWAIPYGDLLTLLLAFFVVMYAISSLNEGKYRVLSNSLSEAFGGAPRSIQPIQVGPVAPADLPPHQSRPIPLGARANPIRLMPSMRSSYGPQLSEREPAYLPVAVPANDRERYRHRGAQAQLGRIAMALEDALEDLAAANLVRLTHGDYWIEVSINSDILFASGSAALGENARRIIARLAPTLAEVPNLLRVEGHTDDRPIHTAAFPSNWELSAARAASVVHVLAADGVAPGRMAVVGQGEFHPSAANDTPEGRNANRRVALIILATPEAEADAAGEPDIHSAQAGESPPAASSAPEAG
ncbi:flagellar motor protein MotD [Coralloluteibacterium stylophorae]|uniref:Flagellar motor protein MotD n=1 Tax=Coralloluteibacterium stylophorae TaxID=1776034 RepID=A0A8J8AY95_9GAMM|nr:flagellar motor protein MotD [Coralloluteibacterium stylophorae]MBS7457247.1 flagellar motor protein MotD [Coralloluteibacterium stylophorae]